MTTRGAYYNEIDAYAAQWLRNLIAAGHIAPGDVDERSIVDVSADDLKGYTQCHFFAGIGGWSLAARLAGWPDDRQLWTGSCPCQPYSLAGKGLGQADPRDLWPVWFGLVAAVRPAAVMGEQVKDAIGKHWLDRMRVDLESQGYALGATVLPACAVDAPHRRDRLWFVADASGGRFSEQGQRQDQQPRRAEIVGPGHGALADAAGIGSGAGLREGYEVENRDGTSSSGGPFDVAYADQPGESQRWEQRGGQQRGPRSNSRGSAWIGAEWLAGADGKARRFEPGIRLLAHGVPARVGKLRAYGNAIVPVEAAEVIGAYLDAA